MDKALPLIMLAAPHLIITAPQGYGKKELLKILAWNLRANKSTVIVHDPDYTRVGWRECQRFPSRAMAIQAATKELDNRFEHLRQTEEAVACLFGGSLDGLNEAERAYHHKEVKRCYRNFKEFWLIINDYLPDGDTEHILRLLKQGGDKINIHLILSISDITQCGLTQDNLCIARAIWYKANEPNQFRFSSLATDEWWRRRAWTKK